MPVAVACPKCQKKYNLPDNMLGRPVKCTACQTQFKTPGPNSRPAKSAGGQKVDPRQQAARQKAQLAAQRQAQELKQMGLDGPIAAAPDVFAGAVGGGPDPLANHVIEDPGFGTTKNKSAPTKEAVPDPDDMSQMFVNPALEKPKQKKKPALPPEKSRKTETTKWYGQVWFMLIAILLPLLIANIVLVYTEAFDADTLRTISMITFWTFVGLNACVGIWGNIVVGQVADGLEVILCRFVPGYIIFFSINNWHAMKGFIYASIVGVLLTPLAIAVVVFAGIWTEFQENGFFN